MRKLYLDLETRSGANLKAVGVYQYVRDPHFKVLLCSWSLDDDDVRVWDVVSGKPMPERLRKALADPRVRVVIANSTFDRTAIRHSEDFDYMKLPTTRIIDTMVQALAHGLPGGLEALSNLFGLEQEGAAKMREGRTLIQQFCTPVRGKKQVQFYGQKDFPAQWASFVEYARQDIVAMREIHKRLPTLNYPKLEHHLWVIDQRINDRGLPVDLELATAAVKEQQAERARLNARTKKKTHGEVGAATQRDALLMHLATEHDVWLPDLKSDTLARYLEQPELPQPVRSLIELRQNSSLTSASKYRHVLQRQVKGRLQGTMQMYGAARTGRDAGRVFQPQNLMRHTRWRGLSGDALTRAIETDVAAITSGAASFVDSNVMDLLGNCVRGVIKAPEGKKLVVADLSNIEGRCLVWLADEEWKLKYFRDYDTGVIKYDNYVTAYSEAMNVSPESVGHYERQIGKVMELGLGYGGGVAAFLTFASVYRLDIDELADEVWKSGDQGQLQTCLEKHDWAKDNGYHAGLEPRQYAACEYLKQQWRDSHPQTVKFWYDLENAFRTCTERDGVTVRVGRLAFRRQGQWLYIRLPSGRCLVYLQPKIVDGNCSFIGVDGYTRRLDRLKTYSGRLAENVTSAAARDVMFHNIPHVESLGYEIVLRVHDELVTETPDEARFSADALAKAMIRPHEWADGLPLAADGFETYRYRED